MYSLKLWLLRQQAILVISVCDLLISCQRDATRHVQIRTHASGTYTCFWYIAGGPACCAHISTTATVFWGGGVARWEGKKVVSMCIKSHFQVFPVIMSHIILSSSYLNNYIISHFLCIITPLCLSFGTRDVCQRWERTWCTCIPGSSPEMA